MCSSLIFLSHTNNNSFFFLRVSFGRFRYENYANIWGHYWSRIVGTFSRPFSETSSLTMDILWWYGFFFMKECAPFIFLRSWVFVALYLCSRFHIFNKPVLEEYVY
jgi:hypothetical protein